MNSKQTKFPEEIQKALEENDVTAFEEIFASSNFDTVTKNEILYGIVSSSKTQTDKGFVQSCLK